MAEKKETEVLTLNDKLAIIQTEFKSKKSRFNSFGKYNFRSAEDILEATKPFLLRLGVTVTVNEELKGQAYDFPIIYSIATISDGQNSIQATALVGVDLDQKGMQMPQKFGSASSYGKKYALGNLFLIDDTQDADHGKAEPADKAKTALKTGTPEFEKAVAFVSNGGSLTAIETKYSLTDEVKRQLTTL